MDAVSRATRRTWLARIGAAAPCLLAVVSFAGSASAQGTDPAGADALFQKGREAAEKGEWGVACPKFAESQRLDPAVGTLLNLADCEEHLGQHASAYEHLRTALETMAPSDDRIPFAKKRLAEVEHLVPHLTLTPSADLPADAKVLRDDVQLGSASFGLALPVNPGTHSIVVSAPGHAERRFSVTLRAGESQTIPLRAGEAVAASPPASPPPAAAPAPRTGDEATPGPSGGARMAGYAVGAVGLVGIGVGAVTGALVLGKKSIIDDPTHCDPTTHVCDSAGVDAANSGKTLSAVSTVAFVAGGALLVTGAILVLTSGHAAASATLFGPETYAGGGAGLRVIHAF